MIMRKFLVHSRIHQVYGEYVHFRDIVELNHDEKANEETFERKVNPCGVRGVEVMSWSLIEE